MFNLDKLIQKEIDNKLKKQLYHINELLERRDFSIIQINNRMRLYKDNALIAEIIIEKE